MSKRKERPGDGSVLAEQLQKVRLEVGVWWHRARPARRLAAWFGINRPDEPGENAVHLFARLGFLTAHADLDGQAPAVHKYWITIWPAVNDRGVITLEHEMFDSFDKAVEKSLQLGGAGFGPSFVAALHGPATRGVASRAEEIRLEHPTSERFVGSWMWDRLRETLGGRARLELSRTRDLLGCMALACLYGAFVSGTLWASSWFSEAPPNLAVAFFATAGLGLVLLGAYLFLRRRKDLP